VLLEIVIFLPSSVCFAKARDGGQKIAGTAGRSFTKAIRLGWEGSENPRRADSIYCRSQLNGEPGAKK
jgi:hypothetical protein